MLQKSHKHVKIIVRMLNNLFVEKIKFPPKTHVFTTIWKHIFYQQLYGSKSYNICLHNYILIAFKRFHRNQASTIWIGALAWNPDHNSRKNIQDKHWRPSVQNLTQRSTSCLQIIQFWVWRSSIHLFYRPPLAQVVHAIWITNLDLHLKCHIFQRHVQGDESRLLESNPVTGTQYTWSYLPTHRRKQVWWSEYHNYANNYMVQNLTINMPQCHRHGHIVLSTMNKTRAPSSCILCTY